MIEIPPKLLDSKDPFFVCSKHILRTQVKDLQRIGADLFYSVKTNPDPPILRVLADLGLGFSVSNTQDFSHLLSLGVDVNRILYCERGLTEDKVSWLVERGCKNFVVDTQRAFENLYPSLDTKSLVLFRTGRSKATNRYQRGYIPHLAPSLISAMIKKCPGRVGVLHHTFSQGEDPELWSGKFEDLKEWSVDVVDIGGGLPIDYSTSERDTLSEELLRILRGGISALRDSGVGRVFMEPGRFIVGPACSLVTRAVLVNGGDVILNASVYRTHIDTIIAGIELPARTLKTGRKHSYRLLGSSLCSLDVFRRRALLPHIDEGDIIIFDKAGAYNSLSEFGSGCGVKSYLI